MDDLSIKEVLLMKVEGDKPQAVTFWDWLGLAAYVAIVFILATVIALIGDFIYRWISG